MEDHHNWKFTDRALRILHMADREAEKNKKPVYPIHILLGALIEGTGVCAELFLNYPDLNRILKNRLKNFPFPMQDSGINFHPLTNNIALLTKEVLEKAYTRMKRYNQIYINEGHLIRSIFELEEPFYQTLFEGIDVSGILNITSSPRDMITCLKEYAFPSVTETDVTYRKAALMDRPGLKSFVEKEFGKGWLNSIDVGFQNENIPIYIALQHGEFAGFACFDVVRGKKGVFGPMGISLSNRVKGIGSMLLHFCLAEMKTIGYEYAVIGEAGPMEFYEKSCNAVLVPLNGTSGRGMN